MIVFVISNGYPKPIRNPMGTSMDINFYPRIQSWADIGCNRRYGCVKIFAISYPNPIRCHPYPHPHRTQRKYYGASRHDDDAVPARDRACMSMAACVGAVHMEMEP
jgi:hypothetical protein